MPLLSHEQQAELLSWAHLHRPCNECGRHGAYDYCRTCDQFFWHHNPGCMMYENHDGHRQCLVPFVEVR